MLKQVYTIEEQGEPLQENCRVSSNYGKEQGGAHALEKLAENSGLMPL